MVENPLISIIVTSYSTERINDIYELLDSIAAQEYREIETIYVTEKSPELPDLVRNYGSEKKINDLTVLFNEGEPGLSAARNLGIGEARGEILAFVDDDTVLFPEWAGEIAKAFEDTDVIGVTGPALPGWEDPALSWFPEEFYWIVSCTAWDTNEKKREVRNAWGMNMSFRREGFEKAGLFKNEFGLSNSARKRWFDPPSEDVDLSMRVRKATGKTICFIPTVKVYHKVYRYRLEQKFIRQRSFSVGYQRDMIRKLYAGMETESSVLDQEYGLLKRIFFRLFPSIVRKFFSKPGEALKISRVTALSLSYVAMGYFLHRLPGIGTKK